MMVSKVSAFDKDHPVAGGAEPWQSILAEATCDPAELCRRLDLPPRLATEAVAPSELFPLLVPGPYLARIRRGDPTDPLLRQVLPSACEGATAPGFTADPLGEAATDTPGWLWKYPGRSLIVATGACAVHCRFCFRRHFPFGGLSGAPATWEPALGRIAAEPSLREVILSGGDPLTVPDDDLTALVDRLAAIPHLKRLRVHTRMPVVIPQRVSGRLVAWLRGTRLAPVMVVHVNHPAEIDGDVAAALGRLVDAGVPLLSQTVLLRGVNDRLGVLAELYERLADLRVTAYYLHQLDRVAGAAHFEVPVSRGRRLMAGLRARLPGYAVPRYVRQTPDGPCKELLG